MQAEPHPRGPRVPTKESLWNPSEMTSCIALCEGDMTPLSLLLLAGWPRPSEVP